MRWNLLPCHLQQVLRRAFKEIKYQTKQPSSMKTPCGSHVPPHLGRAVPFSAIQLLSNCPLPRNLQQRLCARCPLNQGQLETHWSILLRQDHGMCDFFLPEFAQLAVFRTDGSPLKECFVWDKALAETCPITCQLTFWYALMRLLGHHSLRSRRAEMVGSSSSSPWRFLAAWLCSSSQRA